VPVEVLFDKICRENGIAQRLTKPRSPPLSGQPLLVLWARLCIVVTRVRGVLGVSG